MLTPEQAGSAKQPKRGRGRPRKWASDAERVRAWRAAERARRQLMRGEVDVGAMAEKLRRAEEERDRNWEQVLELQKALRAAETHPADGADRRPAEPDPEHVRWQQQATDLAAVVGHVTGVAWDHPLFGLVDRRARQAVADGAVLATSIVDEPSLRLPAGPPEQQLQSAPVPTVRSRAERRRLEREARRRGHS